MKRFHRYTLTILERIKLRLSRSRVVPSPCDWDAGRLRIRGLASSRAALPSLDDARVGNNAKYLSETGLSELTHGRINSIVSKMHWISLVCFLEGIAPQELMLMDDLLLRVEDDLAQLSNFSAIDVYAAGLEFVK
jgi:hypothetical protein